MSGPVISLNASTPRLRALIGSDPDAYVALITMAQAGVIPAIPTRTGGFLIRAADLPLILAALKDFRSN